MSKKHITPPTNRHNAVWLVIVCIGLSIAYSILKADSLTLKTPDFELHTEAKP